MSRLEQPQRLDLGLFAEACERLKLDQTLTVRVVLDDTVREPLECLVEVMRFNMTHDLALVGIGTELKLYERFVTPDWVKDRYRAVRRIETILAELNGGKKPTTRPVKRAVERNGK